MSNSTVPKSVRETGGSLPAIIKRTDPTVLWSIAVAIVAVASSYGVMLYKVEAIEDYISEKKAKDEQQQRDIRAFYADKMPVITNGLARNTARLESLTEDIAEMKELVRDMLKHQRRGRR